MSTEPVRTVEPDRLAQGEKINWEVGYRDYPATLWTLEYRYRGPGTGFNVSATANGIDFDASLSLGSGQTVGKYLWQAWATNIADTSIVRKVAEGTLTVEQGFATATTTAIETRSAAKITLDAIDAALQAAGSSDVIMYEITTPAGGRRVQKSRTEMLAMRKYYAAIVAKENQAERVRNGGKFMKQIVGTFYER